MKNKLIDLYINNKIELYNDDEMRYLFLSDKLTLTKFLTPNETREYRELKIKLGK